MDAAVECRRHSGGDAERECDEGKRIESDGRKGGEGRAVVCRGRRGGRRRSGEEGGDHSDGLGSLAEKRAEPITRAADGRVDGAASETEGAHRLELVLCPPPL